MSPASSLAISLGGLRDKGHIKLVAFSVDTQAKERAAGQSQPWSQDMAPALGALAKAHHP